MKFGRRKLWTLLWTHCRRLSCSAATSASEASLSVVLGIETSCDDTAVCVLSSDRRILSSRRHADRDVQRRLGGICPSVSSQQHRNLIDGFVEECLAESGMRLSDLSAVAVTTRPGLVLALKVGADRAVSICKKGRLPLVSVHHMQAHATMASLEREGLSFPFVATLLSGGHALIALAHGASRFEVLSSSARSSPGECLDKLARQLALQHADLLQEHSLTGLHDGAILEALAARCSTDGHLRYHVPMPTRANPNFDFTSLRVSCLRVLRTLSQRGNVNLNDFCASVQHSLAGYIACKLHHCLEYLIDTKKISQGAFVVASGGVASNGYVRRSLQKIASFYGLSFCAPPAQYCTDNAEMVAWNGLLLLKERNTSAIIPADSLPASMFVEARSPLGNDISLSLPRLPRLRLSMKSLAEDKLVFHYKPRPALP